MPRIVPRKTARPGDVPNHRTASSRYSVAGLASLGAMSAALFAACPGPAARAAPPAGTCDVQGVVAHALPAIVNISVVRVLGATESGKPTPEHFEVFVGSGAIIDPSGIIVTNKHVIQDGAIIRVTFQDRSQVGAQLIEAANLVDLAVLKVDVGHPLPTLSFGNSDALRIGQPVIAIGNPLGVGTSVTTGVVSGVNRNLMRSAFDDYIQTDASINPGNSGGPLLDCTGHIVGVDTALYSNNSLLGSIGLGFAQPANDVNFVVSMLRNPAMPSPNWLGLHLQDVSALVGVAFARPNTDGAIVTEVDPNSPASKASLRPGDIITAVGKEELPDSRAIQRAFLMRRVGEPLALTVWRGGHETTATLTGEPWPHMVALRDQVLASPENIRRAEEVGLGLYVSQITDADRQRYGLNDAKGVIIDQVIPGSQAENMSLAAGDVIEQVGEQPATSAREVEDDLMMRATAPGKLVALLVRSKSGSKWAALWVGQINEKDVVAGIPPIGPAGGAREVSGKPR